MTNYGRERESGTLSELVKGETSKKAKKLLSIPSRTFTRDAVFFTADPCRNLNTILHNSRTSACSSQDSLTGGERRFFPGASHLLTTLNLSCSARCARSKRHFSGRASGAKTVPRTRFGPEEESRRGDASEEGLDDEEEMTTGKKR